MIRPLLFTLLLALAGCDLKAGIATEDVPDAGASEAGFGCQSNTDCPSGKVCSYDQGCGTLTRSCQDDTSGDAVALAFCGCDGQTFTTSQAHPTQPWASAGACGTDGGQCSLHVLIDSPSRLNAENACTGLDNCFVCARQSSTCTTLYRAYQLAGGCTCADPGACVCPADPGVDAGVCDGGGLCPAAAPTVGAACSLPSGAECTYGDTVFTRDSCGSATFACTSGQWQETVHSDPGPCCPNNDPAVLAANGCNDAGTPDAGSCPADPNAVQTGVSCGAEGTTCQGYSPCALTYVDCTCTGGQWDCGSCIADGGNGGPPCGSTTCAPNQVCVHPCSGIALDGGGSPPPYCVDIPTSCNSPSCECVRPGACPGLGDAGTSGPPVCSEPTPGQLYCNGCA